MGYHNIWGEKPFQAVHRSIALGLIQKNLGGWQPGHSRKHPEIHVEMIANFSRIYRPFRTRGWMSWVRRLGIF